MGLHTYAVVARRVLIAATLIGPVIADAAQQPAGAQEASTSAESKFSFEGDTALWTVAIKPDQTTAFEQVMARLREALLKADNPERQRQAAGWKVLRLSTPLPDGSVGYLHMVHPVVPGADYTVMRILYDEFPNERQALYDLYRGAFSKNVALATGRVAVDLARPPAVPLSAGNGTP